MGKKKYLERWVLEPATLLAEEFNEAIDKLRGGGPPTPMHPSPAGDDALLRRLPKKVESDPGC